MFIAGRMPLFADAYTPFTDRWTFIDIDFSGATLKAQVRDRKDGGMVRVDLATVEESGLEGLYIAYAGTDSVADHIAAGHLTAADAALAGLLQTDVIDLSVVEMRIDEATIETMPTAPEIGDDFEFYWDLHVTPPGEDKQVYLFGPFTRIAGVTQ